MTHYSAADLALLQEELLRVVARGGHYGTFTIDDDHTNESGTKTEGATETDVINHLTSKRDFISGRQTRFPGIGNGWNFSDAIRAAGFRIVYARNVRNQRCRIVTL